MTTVYHFTHKDNFASIISRGCILCDKLRLESAISHRNIAYGDLKRRRSEITVTAGSGGRLDSYTPFYFGSRSPMLYAYTNGYVTGRKENQDDLLYLVTQAETVRDAGLSFVFTDGHPVREPRNFYDDLTELNNVDLKLMQQKMWNDTDDDPDRKRRRQAEFLVRGFLPWRLVLYIGARTERIAAEVSDQVALLEHRPKILVRPTWYY